MSSLVLRPSHLQPLTAFHKKTLRSFLSLSEKSPIPSLYFFLGELPIEAKIHRDMFSLFFCIWNNPDTKIYKLVLYLLENMDNNSRTWSAHLSNVAKMYDITPPLELMRQSPPSKASFKEHILTKITSFHESELRISAKNNSKMKYFNVSMTGLRGRHHRVLDGPVTTHQVRKLRPVIKFLCGDYYTLEMKHRQTGKGSPNCRLCPDGIIEDVQHIVAGCDATSVIRLRFLDTLRNILPNSKSCIDPEKIFGDKSILTQFLLDPNSMNLPNDTRIHIDDPISSEIFSLARDLCFNIHTERLKKMKEIETEEKKKS